MESAVQALYMVSVVQRRVWWCLVICQTGAWMDGMDEGVGGWVVRRKKERKKESVPFGRFVLQVALQLQEQVVAALRPPGEGG